MQGVSLDRTYNWMCMAAYKTCRHHDISIVRANLHSAVLSNSQGMIHKTSDTGENGISLSSDLIYACEGVQ